MSMFRCYWCDELSDSDRDLAVLIHEQLMCGYCFNILSCDHCAVQFDVDDCRNIVRHGNGCPLHYHSDCWNEVRKVITADAKRDEMRDEG